MARAMSTPSLAKYAEANATAYSSERSMKHCSCKLRNADCAEKLHGDFNFVGEDTEKMFLAFFVSAYVL